MLFQVMLCRVLTRFDKGITSSLEILRLIMSSYMATMSNFNSPIV